MKRRKKKVNSQQSKQERETRLKIYKQKIFNFLKLIDCEEVLALIDKDTLKNMYRERNDMLPKIRHSEGVIVNHRSVRKIQGDLDALISGMTIKVGPYGNELSAKDVTAYMSIIYRMVMSNKQSADANVIRIVKQFMDKFPELNRAFQQANSEVIGAIWFVGLSLTHINERFCWMVRIANNNEAGSTDYILAIKEKVAQSINVVIDHHPRPVFPLAMAYPSAGPIEVSVSSDKLNLDNAVRNMPIPVYIQNHVLHRMEERLDSITRYMREFYLYVSMEDPKVIHFKVRILVEYNLGTGNKLGYLIVDYLNGILLVKTFLLLSNSGTPEGLRLEESSGLKKIDRQYWAIDRLSTFQQSDLKDHPQIKEIFEHAGCGSLFNDLPVLSRGQKMHNNQAMQMLKYLKMDKEQEELLINESNHGIV